MSGSRVEPQPLSSAVSALCLLRCEGFVAFVVTYPKGNFRFFTLLLDLPDRCVPLIPNTSLKLPSSCVTFMPNSTRHTPSMSVVSQNQSPTELPPGPKSLVHTTQLPPQCSRQSAVRIRSSSRRAGAASHASARRTQCGSLVRIVWASRPGHCLWISALPPSF